MLVHLVFDDVADGPLGVGLDVMLAVRRLAENGLLALPSAAPTQRLASVDGHPVTTQAGRLLPVDAALPSLGPGDVLLLPGLGATTPAAVDALLARPDVRAALPAIAAAHASGALVAASCSATFLLAAAGLLDGREATTTWWLTRHFARRFPRVRLCPDRMVVPAERLLTAGSAFAHADLALAIAAHLAGPEAAALAARYLVLDHRPSQARYMVLDHLRTADPVVQALERHLKAHLSQQVSLAAMARATATSPRTLARKVQAALGTSPQAFARRVRIAHARHLLETTREPLGAIAAAVGYADPAAFRRTFKQETGLTPSAVRFTNP